MSRLVYLSIAWCAVSGGTVRAADRESRPNVIVILADDLGYADLGFQGCKDIPTPHLDRLAASGVRCTAAYASCPVCAPTRAGLLTGRYQQRFGFEYNPAIGPKAGLPIEERTLADLLHDAGYVTGAIGKWHLGKPEGFHPLERGFDEFYGFTGGGRPYFPIDEKVKVPFAPNDPLVRGRDRIKTEPPYLTTAFGNEAAAFVERHREKPFFLYLAFNAVHVPLQAPQEYLDRFGSIESKARRAYAAMTGAMDDAVGTLLAELERAQLREDTLIFFLSDNGGHPIANAASNAPLRGEKSTIYEGGVRVPFVVSWPGHLPAGKTYAQPVSSLDIASTALSAAGATDEIARRKLDGVDLVPFLNGERSGAPHEVLYWRYGPHRAIRHGNWKLTLPGGGLAELFDVEKDISETNDLAADHPEIVKDLSSQFDAWEATVEGPRWPDLFNRDWPKPK
jgi:arylsulfatase A-like enzyme